MASETEHLKKMHSLAISYDLVKNTFLKALFNTKSNDLLGKLPVHNRDSVCSALVRELHIIILTITYYYCRGAKYCEQHVSVCFFLYVCMYVRSHMSNITHTQTSRIVLYMLTVAVALSSSNDNTIRYVLPVLWNFVNCLLADVSPFPAASAVHSSDADAVLALRIVRRSANQGRSLLTTIASFGTWDN